MPRITLANLSDATREVSLDTGPLDQLRADPPLAWPSAVLLVCGVATLLAALWRAGKGRQGCLVAGVVVAAMLGWITLGAGVGLLAGGVPDLRGDLFREVPLDDVVRARALARALLGGSVATATVALVVSLVPPSRSWLAAGGLALAVAAGGAAGAGIPAFRLLDVWVAQVNDASPLPKVEWEVENPMLHAGRTREVKGKAGLLKGRSFFGHDLKPEDVARWSWSTEGPARVRPSASTTEMRLTLEPREPGEQKVTVKAAAGPVLVAWPYRYLAVEDRGVPYLPLRLGASWDYGIVRERANAPSARNLVALLNPAAWTRKLFGESSDLDWRPTRAGRTLDTRRLLVKDERDVDGVHVFSLEFSGTREEIKQPTKTVDVLQRNGHVVTLEGGRPIVDEGGSGDPLFPVTGTELVACQLPLLFPADCVCLAPSVGQPIAGVISCQDPHQLKDVARTGLGILSLGTSEALFHGSTMSERLLLGRQDGRSIEKLPLRPGAGKPPGARGLGTR